MEKTIKQIGVALIIAVATILLNKYFFTMSDHIAASILYFTIALIIIVLILFIWQYSIDRKQMKSDIKSLVESHLREYAELRKQIEDLK